MFETSSEQHPDVVHAKVDTDAERGLSQAAGIASIPTLMAFRDGILVVNQAGALPGSAERARPTSGDRQPQGADPDGGS